MAAGRPWRIDADGLMLLVRLTPKGGRDALEGIDPLADGTVVMKARVRAAPHDGAANEALRKLVGRAVGVAPRRVSIVAGATARTKTLRIEGDGAKLAAMLDEVTSEVVS